MSKLLFVKWMDVWTYFEYRISSLLTRINLFVVNEYWWRNKLAMPTINSMESGPEMILHFLNLKKR